MTYQEYITGTHDIPDRMSAWYLYGQGIEHFGKDDAPVAEAVPDISTDELLVRVDAVGICASDAKMIRLGNTYPLFLGRDLGDDPARLGHELALTIVKIGDDLQDDYNVGQRLSVQPDVFYQTVRKCIGVILPGGMTQYMVIGQEVLDGDDGSYVFTTQDSLSYADVAVFEPWACVDAAYRPFRRLHPLKNGVMWIHGQGNYNLDFEVPSKLVIASDVSPSVLTQLQEQHVELAIADELTLDEILEQYTDDGQLDDIILLSPDSPELIASAHEALSKRGTLVIASQDRLDDVPIDVGRLHYDFTAILGTNKSKLSSAYGESNNRTELKKDGVLLIHGAGGPMGQMHTQRALTMPDGPRIVIVTNRGLERLHALEQQFAPIAKQHHNQLIAISPTEQPDKLRETVGKLTGGIGCDDIVMMFPSREEIGFLRTLLSQSGVLNLFAGLPHGNMVEMDINPILTDGMQIIGTSGSSLNDQKRVLAKATDGIIAPAQIVSAIGGLNAVKEAIIAVNERRFAGKIVIYPAFTELPLLSLSDLQVVYPAIYALLGDNDTWTKQAEDKLFQTLLG